MKFIPFTSLLLIFSISFSFQEEISSYIFNGEDAKIEDHPYMAHIFTLMFPSCGSSIITSRSLVTAAHCLTTFISQPGLVSVVVGTANRNGTGGVTYRTSRILLHPNYTSEPKLLYDVAVLRTLRRIEFGPLVQPIPLGTDEYIGIDAPGVFTGWGSIRYGIFFQRPASTLQKMYTRTISNDDCRNRLNETDRADYIFEQKLCVVSGPQTTVCGGDSGGPLVIDGKVAGILSWRTFPCGNGLPDVFIRISVTRDWINSVLV